MRNYNPFLLFFLVAVFFIRSEAEQKTTHLACKISREYITTHKYLSEKLKDYGLESQQIDLIANKVSVGCTGAASRFIRSLKFLSQVEVGTREAIQISTELSNKTDQHTEVFLKVFKRSYFKSSLDLDLSTSLSFAKALSLAYSGDVKLAGRDFENTLSFCKKEIKLPLSQCGQLALSLAEKGILFEKGVSNSFTEIFQFLRSSKGPGLTITEALSVSQKVTSFGQGAIKNYIHAYKYGVSEEGLSVNAKQAMHFAQRLAQKTNSKESENKL